jgi:hypothetical protein
MGSFSSCEVLEFFVSNSVIGFGKKKPNFGRKRPDSLYGSNR